jgi:hypothetical protein
LYGETYANQVTPKMTRLSILTILILYSAVGPVGAKDTLKIKKRFNTVLVNKDKFTFSKAKTIYKEALLNKIGDTLFYRVNFSEIIHEPFILAKINGQYLMKNEYFTSALNPEKYQLLFDITAKKGDRWNAGGIFNHSKCTIIFEDRINDQLTNEDLYIFIVEGDYATSHSDYVTKIYISPIKGIVRLDFNKLSMGEKDEKAISFADNFIKRSQIKSYLKTQK